ncbi:MULTISPECIES: enoyl-ACP reductase FabI [Microbacterium]|uniref:enoyl-ACP reductase FabI n=1 Tax=Microbacterium TaxID=33882 RepID=UPI0025F7B0BD|nr:MULTISPECIES: enoyl-ACP reductase FabI [Microbacterium]
MGIVDGKRLLVTGVLTDASLAFEVARLAQLEGAEVLLTGAGRGLSLTERTARKLPEPCDVLALDVTAPAEIAAVRDEIDRRWGRLDGLLHAIGFAPEACLGGNFLNAEWDDVAVAVHVSAYSLKALAATMAPLMARRGDDDASVVGGSVVGLTFDASVAWPVYDWMGVAKAAFESVARYLAKSLGPDGIRVNLVSAGPIRTMAARSIPGFDEFEQTWLERSPLGWDVEDSTAVARSTLALLSDWFPMTTGEIVHVDGGYHAMGA